MAADRFFLIALKNVPEVVNKMIFESKKCLDVDVGSPLPVSRSDLIERNP